MNLTRLRRGLFDLCAYYLSTACSTYPANLVIRVYRLRPEDFRIKSCDFSVDNEVNFEDYRILSDLFMKPESLKTDVMDLTGDSVIGIDDISELAENWLE